MVLYGKTVWCALAIQGAAKSIALIARFETRFLLMIQSLADLCISRYDRCDYQDRYEILDMNKFFS